MRKHVIQAVFKRNFLSYFSGVIGYLFIVAFVGAGSIFAFSPKFFANNLANLDQLTDWFPVMLLFIVPAITMGAWADERKLGTDELLFTLPASDLEILLGKYLAVVGVYTVALGFSLSHVIVLCLLRSTSLGSWGAPDLGLMCATYFGYWIAGSALLSAGLVASIVTNSTPVAYVLGAAVCAVPVFIDKLGEIIAPSKQFLQGLSLAEQLRDFGLGMIPLGGILYFASLTGLMLYINLVLISRRHWSGGPHGSPMGLHFTARSICLALILFSFNVVAARGNSRIDMTAEHVYSLSPTTIQLLRAVKPERPVMIQAFISPEVPRDYVTTRSTLIGLLRQFDQVGGNAVRVRITNTERFTDAADEARRFGIEPQPIQSERAGRFVQDDVYLGVVVSGSADDEVTVPFFDLGTPVEYELARSVRTVSEARRLKLGILRTDAKLTGGFDMQSFRSQPEWRIVTELKKQYDVKEVGPEELASAKYDVVLAAMPSTLTEPEMKNLVDYVRRGGATLIIDDPFPVTHPDLSPKLPKPRAGGGMFGGGPPPQPKADNGELRQLATLLGLGWNSSQTTWDPTYDPHPDLSALLERLDVVYVGENNGSATPFGSKSEISKGLQEVMLLYPGSLRKREGTKLDMIPLLRTSPNAFTLEWDEYAQSNPMLGGAQPLPSPEPRFPPTPVEQVLAAKITGETDDKTDGKEAGKINVVFLADLDMISDAFFTVRDKKWQDLNLDNITLLLNAIDDLAGDDSLLALRKRRNRQRTLSRIEKLTEEFKTKFSEERQRADKEAKKELDEAKKRLAAEIEKLKTDTTMDDRTKMIKLATANENERRRVEVEEANIQNIKNKKVQESKNITERKIRSVEGWYATLAVLLPPIPALLLGIFVFASRVREERQGIVPDRLVQKKH